MATTTKTTARKTTARKPATRSTTATRARSTAAQAQTTAASAQHTAREAQRTTQTLASEGVYAVVGLGDRAIEFARTLPERVSALTQDVPGKLRSRVELLASEYDAYATRGRKVVNSVRNTPAIKRAVGQTRIARSQVKGATTSVRKAVGESVDAVDAATSKVGQSH